MRYACFGDSITSDQVTGTGTRICELLKMEMIGNYACGYATCSDWHRNSASGRSEHTSPISFEIPPNTNTTDNVLSNQIRRILRDTTRIGDQIRWKHPIDGVFSIDPKLALGLGCKNTPDIIYIAIGTNDGNHPENPVIDDRELVFTQNYRDLTCESISSALRWSIETLQSAYPYAMIYVASPLQTYCDLPWMDYPTTKLKRDIIRDTSRFCGVRFIDSFFESGFSRLVAKDHGEVHPDDGWKENIARFVAGRIMSGCCLNGTSYK